MGVVMIDRGNSEDAIFVESANGRVRTKDEISKYLTRREDEYKIVGDLIQFHQPAQDGREAHIYDLGFFMNGRPHISILPNFSHLVRASNLMKHLEEIEVTPEFAKLNKKEERELDGIYRIIRGALKLVKEGEK